MESTVLAQSILEKLALSPAFAERAIMNKSTRMIAQRKAVMMGADPAAGVANLHSQLAKLPTDEMMLAKAPRAAQLSGIATRRAEIQAAAMPNNARFMAARAAEPRNIPTVNVRAAKLPQGNVNTPMTNAPTVNMNAMPVAPGNTPPIAGRRIMPAKPQPIPRMVAPSFRSAVKAAAMNYSEDLDTDSTNTHPALVAGGFLGGASGLTSGALHYHGADLLETKPEVNSELISKLESKGIMSSGKFKNKLLYAGKRGLIAGGIGAGLGAAAGGLMHHYYNTKTAAIVHNVIVKLAEPAPVPEGSLSKTLWKNKGKVGIGVGLGLGAIAASRGAFSSEPRGMYQPGQQMPKYSSKTAAITHQAITNLLRA